MKERERQRETQWDRESHGCQWMINKSSAYSTVNHQNALNRTRTSRFQLSKHTCSPTSTKRHTDTQKYAYKRPHSTLTHWHVQGSRYTSYSLVPSSETIPRPSALFCLSNAFRSRTLSTRRDVNSLLKELKEPGTSKRYRPAGLHQGLNAEEESHVLLILQIVQHFLHTEGLKHRQQFRCCPASNSSHVWVRPSPVARHCCLRWGWRFPVWVWKKPWPPARLQEERWTLVHGCRADLRDGESATFTSADHLQHHLRSPAVVEAGLLVQKPLLLHLFFLWSRAGGETLKPCQRELHCPPADTHALPFTHSVY